MAIKKYKSKDATKLSTNFRVNEFACKCGKCTEVPIDEQLVVYLQKIRDHFKKPVTITSAYRTVARNNAVKGAKYSQHLYGNAADIKVQGTAPKTVSEYADKLMSNKGGIGTYSTFTHIDVRATKSRWNG